MSGKLYHYTSEAGFEGMRRSGRIRASEATDGDAILGKGVYLTHLAPTENSAKIISNNWDRGLEITQQFVDEYLEKVDLCLEFSSKDLRGLKKLRGQRDVVMYPGDIDLENIPYTMYRRHITLDYGDDDNDDNTPWCNIL